MAHVIVLLWALAFGAGLAAITLTHQLHRQKGANFLRHYLHYLLLANLTVGGTVLLTYLAANLAAGWTVSDWRPAAILFLLASFAVVAAFVYKLVAVMLGLLGRELSRRSSVVFGAIVAATPPACLVPLWAQHRDLPAVLIVAASETMNLGLVAVAAAAIVGVLVASRSLSHRPYRRSVRVFCALHLLAYLLIALAALFHYGVAFGLLFISFSIMNLVPLLLLRPLLQHREGSELAVRDEADAVRTLAARHGISPREGEIIQLLLAGSTNAEIGEVLCISSNTVKNHVYSVYRKTGVRNRIELRVLEAEDDALTSAPR
jgi:DNA-binding CsgD family transcriptional regulator